MKSKIQRQVVKFLLFFGLVTPFVITYTLPDLSFSTEYNNNYFELTNKSYSSSDCILSETNDDLEETSFFFLSSFSLFSYNQYSSIASYYNFTVLSKIPFELFSIPPPLS
ncbi:MAG TPA: hypothetical protein PK079_16595 [Leptospiraceae bacterium]|nr:hypothetical protein [Leptospiraceae bacterium]HMW07169.1 hypothetical protein [Leptospiraceae bacterium]HMX33433.1 hypothetical protein [Leptospiraceae bacterium]HMY32785.1 hypothetical protein [Leptospiraceae bacterium]HMZ65030.1 hypothetical protein [Leptospiraceae bacterium]